MCLAWLVRHKNCTYKLEFVCMKKLILILIVFAGITTHCAAVDYSLTNLLALICQDPKATTQQQVMDLMGKPVKVEETKRITRWYYTNNSSGLVMSWNKKSEEFEKMSFSNPTPERSSFDENLSHKLKSGLTDVKQAIDLLGAPGNMTIREMTQEMHYNFEHSTLRLFFRNQVLVDYTLLTRK